MSHRSARTPRTRDWPTLVLALGIAAVLSGAHPPPGGAEAVADSPPAVEWLQLADGIGRSSWGEGITAGPGGSIYVVGTADASGTGDREPDTALLVARFDPLGNKLWHRLIRAPGTSLGTGIATDTAGNVYVVGIERTNADVAGVLVASFDPNGDRRWLRRIGREGYAERSSAITVGGGQVVVAIEALDRGPSRGEICVNGNGVLAVAFTTDGQRRWVHPVVRTRPGDAFVSSVASRRGGAVDLGMREAPCGQKSRVVLTTLSADGIPTARTEVPPLADVSDVSFTRSGLIVAGEELDGRGVRQGAIAKVNPDGVLWHRQLNSPRGFDVQAVAGFHRQWIVVAGSTIDDAPSDAVIVQYNGNGKFVWRFELRGDAENVASDVVEIGGALYVVGGTRGALEGETPEGESALFLLKLRG